MTLEIPKGDWTFKDANICRNFDQHVREQLPWYDLMTGAVAHIARHYIADKSIVYDLGCSTGNIGNAIREPLEKRSALLKAIDNSEEMRQFYNGPGEFICCDLKDFEPECFSVAVCFLSLMFLGKSDRLRLIERLKSKCNPDGIIIVVDKEEPSGGYLGLAISRIAIAAKAATGTDAKDIIAKELSLAGVQRPLAKSEIDGKEIFRFGDFVGFAIEPNESY